MKFAYVIGSGSRGAELGSATKYSIFMLDRGNTPTRYVRGEDGPQLLTTNDEALRVIVGTCASALSAGGPFDIPRDTRSTYNYAV